MSTPLLQTSVNFLTFSNFHDCSCRKQSLSGLKSRHPINSFRHQSGFKLIVCVRDGWSVLGGSSSQNWNLVRDEERRGRKKRAVVVRFNQGFGFNGGGGGRDNSGTVRILGNLAVAIGLTYLSMTGQLGSVLDAIGWVLDAIVSIWLLAVLLPVVGLGAFLWWAGRDIIQGSCPNCGNIFQIFKSSLNDELQLCPFCSQPFSVVGNEFIKDPVTFSNKSKPLGQEFDGFSHSAKKGKDTSSVVDVEAEIVDAD